MDARDDGRAGQLVDGNFPALLPWIPRQEPVESGAYDLQSALARRVTSEIARDVEQIVGGHETLVIAEGIAQAVLVVDRARLGHAVQRRGFADRADVGVGRIARHVHGNNPQPFTSHAAAKLGQARKLLLAQFATF